MQAVNKVSTVSVSPPILDGGSQAQSLGDDIAISVRNVGFWEPPDSSTELSRGLAKVCDPAGVNCKVRFLAR